jgi:uncharacterized protein YndB with AHSA1/START domain
VVGRQVVDATAHSGAQPDEVWRLVSDSATYPDWGTWDLRELEEEGTPAPEGVGAVRVLRTGRTTVREEITAFEPPQRLAYRLLEGLPINDYEAEVTLSPGLRGGTDIRWHAEFEPKFPVPGFIARRKLQSVFDEATEGLAKAAAG